MQGRRDLNSQPSVLERAENPPTTPKNPSKPRNARDSSGFDPLYAGPMMGKMMGKNRGAAHGGTGSALPIPKAHSPTRRRPKPGRSATLPWRSSANSTRRLRNSTPSALAPTVHAYTQRATLPALDRRISEQLVVELRTTPLLNRPQEHPPARRSLPRNSLPDRRITHRLPQPTQPNPKPSIRASP